MNEAKVGYYLDTSALLPYYREEETSQAIQNFLSSLRFPVGISDLTGLEFVSALSRWVRMIRSVQAAFHYCETLSTGAKVDFFQKNSSSHPRCLAPGVLLHGRSGNSDLR
jgi:hypothetical protein